MPDIIKETIRQGSLQNVEPLPLGFIGCGALFDHQTIERIGVKYIKIIAERSLLAQTQLDQLKKIRDSETCRDFLMSLNYGENKQFLNSTHRIAALCDSESAEDLINCGASQAYDHVTEVIIHAYFDSNSLFEKCLHNKGQTQPFPEKAYQVFPKQASKPLARSLDANKLYDFQQTLGLLYKTKGCTSFTRVTPIKNGNSLGVMVEHSTKKSGYSTLSEIENKFELENPALRLRHTDFFFVDTVNQMLWCNSGLLSGKTKMDLLNALGSLFCEDPNAFVLPLVISMEAFNSPAIASKLKGYEIPSIKLVELRTFSFTKEGFHRSAKTIVPGPYRKGCITEQSDWDSGLPASWKTYSCEIIYETQDGSRETMVISNKSIKTSCSPNFDLGIAFLRHLKVIANNGN